ncbi:class I SAM-dependent methyltransferase [Actinomadura sp. NBRC 104412]|uniref:class I SAM-dependent methyltransferase n=1 Tax=Actinomadura sp. NBRC 104412 TaxID=3032203 RepID=UPI002553BE5D|nr:class I SAM-dependent methyltransferase [Actinomadura sp. NBRC 104412]
MDTIEIQRIVELEDDNWWYRERRGILARELRRTAMPGTAVDIGAAGGGNTRVLREHGWEAIAVDSSTTAVDLCLSQGIEAYHGDARYLPLPSRGQDLALAFNVLEHIEEDRDAAAEIARVLRPGGTALIAVPCDMALWSAHDVALGRVRRYSRLDLVDLLEGAGLVVERLWNWNVLLRPLVRMRRHRARHREDMTQLRPVTNEALRLITFVERHLPVKSWPGVTLFARAHRPWF